MDSGFLTSVDRDLGLPIKLQPESQASSGDEARNSAFLLSCQWDFRPPEELNLGPGVLLGLATGVSELPSCYELILG